MADKLASKDKEEEPNEVKLYQNYQLPATKLVIIKNIIKLYLKF